MELKKSSYTTQNLVIQCMRADAEEAQPSGDDHAAEAADARDSSAEPAAEPAARQSVQQTLPLNAVSVHAE